MPSLINMLWIGAAMAAAIAAGLTVASLVSSHCAAAPELAPAPDVPPLPRRYQCQRWRVLVVTPRALVGQQIAHMLQGHDVAITTSPEAALAAVTQDPEIDVILYTLAMPGVSGFEFAEQHPDLRPSLVFMVERTTSPDIRRRLEVFGVPWIKKPPRYAELATAVDLAARAPREDLPDTQPVLRSA